MLGVSTSIADKSLLQKRAKDIRRALRCSSIFFVL
nr:MAG TPA: hypothetical protein [Caudoviricetes sp.]